MPRPHAIMLAVALTTLGCGVQSSDTAAETHALPLVMSGDLAGVPARCAGSLRGVDFGIAEGDPERLVALDRVNATPICSERFDVIEVRLSDRGAELDRLWSRYLAGLEQLGLALELPY